MSNKPTSDGPHISMAQLASSPAAAPAKSTADLAITLDVEPRKPRLAWQGMERKELAGAVPTQVVEIVSPGRAVERKDELDLSSRSAARAEPARPENRLIWTNDNLVALQTLLDERDAKTKDYRYRGKVDLVYIDPPFMVNADFRADNAIDIELDEKAGVQARKEPSLVEILAYKDTWRQGLDSFLSMLRARLLILKQLLTPTGSIYVHLDWHASHYVKVLMDDVFGYEIFQNEIVWKRTTSRADTVGYNHVHDVILVYGGGASPFVQQVKTPYDPTYIRQHYGLVDKGGRYQPISLTPPGVRGGATGDAWRGINPTTKGLHWKYPPAELDRLDKQGRIYWPERGDMPRLKLYLSEMEGVPLQSIWMDIPPVNAQAVERLGYPTQKPVALVERIITASCPPGGLVLDCFLGSGTTAEAAERLGRRWIGIDNGKYAIHLTRKRLIQLHGQPRPPEKPGCDYVECKTCKNIERKERPKKSPGPYHVRPFTVENMGVYQRASEWQGFQQHRTAYRDEMIKVFGGEPVEHSPLLHGRKGNTWVHVGPLDAPVSSVQVWSIAREAQRTTTKAVTVLSADFDTLSGSEKDEIKKKTGVTVTIRVIPASAIDEVRRRLDLQRQNPDLAVESTAIPAFYAPLSIVLREHVAGRNVEIKLDRCEVDIESFIASQRPMLKPITDRMSEAARKKAADEVKRWEKREKELEAWLAKAKSWQAFVDFWAVDWNYGRQVGEDGKPIFVTEWQSFRSQGGSGDGELTFSAKFSYPEGGRYRVAARVTDVFGNDGIATVEVETRR
ncbi:MAG: site-specific DNA-methyltransferase [Planctomycetes bacterium]|nr:site-specific DNA-methyltransferase [Planctomycetota bacterium]